MNLTRRGFCALSGVAAASVLGLGLAGCGGQAPQAETKAEGPADEASQDYLTQGKGEHLVCGVTGKLIKIAPAIVADKLGYFDEEGCDVEFQQIALNDAMTALTNNQLDMDLFGVVPACTYVSQGAKAYIFGGTILNGSEICALDSFDRELKTAADYKGLRIGVNRPETGQMVFKEWLQDEGLDINGGDVAFTYFDNDQGGFEAVKKGEFDLYITNNAQGFVQRSNGIKVVATVKQYAGDYPCCRQNCSEQALHEKYLSLVDFETALLRGYKTYRQEPDTVIPLLVDYSGQEEAYVRAAMYGTDDYDNVMDPSPDPNKNAVLKFYDTLKNIGEIDTATAYSRDDYVVTSIYRTALDTLLEREPDEQLWKDLDQAYAKNNE